MQKNKIIVLGSSSTSPFPRTVDNKFSDYLDVGIYEKKFELHDDLICNLAKKGGKERRTRSCLAVITDFGSILINAGPDIRYQLEKYRIKPDTVLINHDHSDANFGLKYLEDAEIFAESLGNLKVGRKIKIFGVEITPFRVHHAARVRTFGFKIQIGRKEVVYMSDLSDLDGVRKWIKGCDILFADGSILNQNMPTHLSIINQLKAYRKWRVKKVIFTHIGHKTLPHNELQKYCRSIYPPTEIAYDGLQLIFS